MQYRCPKHDVVFSAQKPPSQNGHLKCPLCSPKEKDGKAYSAEQPAAEHTDPNEIPVT